MASSSRKEKAILDEPINYSGTYILPIEAAYWKPNFRIRVIRADNKNNNFEYEFNVFCDSDEKNINKKSIVVCLYDLTWYKITKGALLTEIQLLQPVSHIHNYDLDNFTPEPMDPTISATALWDLTSPTQSEKALPTMISSSSESSISSILSVNKTIQNTPVVLSTVNSPQITTLTQLPKMTTTTQTTTQTAAIMSSNVPPNFSRSLSAFQLHCMLQVTV